ncbi:MAG: hypothetical protein V4614_16185 [Pseudomonadota bacterium]
MSNEHVDSVTQALDREKIREVFFPFGNERYKQVSERDLLFAHYTSAPVAASIISNQEVWLRNTRTMNDFSEIEYGMECLRHAWKDSGQRLSLELQKRDIPMANSEQLLGEMGQAV